MTLIDEAGELNKQYKKIEKDLNEMKKVIKEENGEGSYDGDNYVAVISTRVRQRKLNQQKALEVVKRIGAKWLLTQIVDEEKLEEALATGEIDPKEFADCIDTTYNTVITFKERKK